MFISMAVSLSSTCSRLCKLLAQEVNLKFDKKLEENLIKHSSTVREGFLHKSQKFMQKPWESSAILLKTIFLASQRFISFTWRHPLTKSDSNNAGVNPNLYGLQFHGKILFLLSRVCHQTTPPKKFSRRTFFSAFLVRLSAAQKLKLFFNPFMVSIIFSNIFHKRFDDKTIILHNSFCIFLGIFSSPISERSASKNNMPCAQTSSGVGAAAAST